MKHVVIAHRLKYIYEKLIISIVKRFVKVTDKMVFGSYPDYSDNVLALTEYILGDENLRRYKIYFIVDNPSFCKKNMTRAEFLAKRNRLGLVPLKTLKVHMQARYLFATHNFLIPEECASKNQKYILLWHGCGYKMRMQPESKKTKRFDAALVPGPLFVKIKAQFWNVDEKYILPIGYPRYDWIKAKDNDALKLINSFRMNEKTKVVMWMPTFRKDKYERSTFNYIKITQFPIIYNIDSWKELDSCCANNNIVILVKLHPYQEDYPIPFDTFTNIKEIKNELFENTNIPMYKFIGVTDALISDYSSIAIDYLIVDKPIAFTLDYYEEEKKTRKFVFDDIREYMPGHHLYNIKDMENFIDDISKGNDLYKDKRKQMYDMCIASSDNYCKSVLDKVGITKC